jgi:hypothetical protein
MRKLALAAALATACSAPRLPTRAQGNSVLEVRGAVKGGPHALGRTDLAQLPRVKVRGVDPATGKEAQFEGVALAELMDRVELRRGADTAVLRTSEKTAVPVPLGVARAIRPVLADHRDGAELPELVLAWPNVEQPALTSDPRSAAWWAHGVVAIEVADWQRTYGTALASPDGATDAARRGASLFGESCIVCHRMRGTGGERGPDLTLVASRMSERVFAAHLPGHPGWRERASAGPEAVEETWAFLKAVAASPGPSPLEPVLEEPAERPVTPPPPSGR